MRKIFSFLAIILLLGACGSSSSNTEASEPSETPESDDDLGESSPTPAPNSPPWEALEGAERDYYVDRAICPAATDVVKEIFAETTPGSSPKWMLLQDTSDAPDITPGGTPLYIQQWKSLVVEDEAAIFLFNGNTNQPTMAILYLVHEDGTTADYMIMNYFSLKLMKDVFDGRDTREIDEDDVFGVANGYYFCLYDPVLESTIYNN